MAPRNVDRDTANQVLQDSLGMSGDDLGMDRDDALSGLDLDGDDDDGLNADDLPGNDQEFSDQNQEDDQQRQPQNRQQQERQPAPKPNEKKPDDLSVTHTPKDEFDHGKPKFDKKGNILGSRGQVIATAGREARMYQQLHGSRERNSQLVTQANQQITDLNGRLQKAVDIGTQVATQLNAMRELGTLHTKAGLDDNDLRQAIDFASAFKRDPIEGLKKILTTAATSGIDLTKLGLQPGGFDTKSLLDLVRAEISKVAQPIQQRTQQETADQQRVREEQEAVVTATRELNTFLTAEPEARQYLPIIQEVLKQPFGAKMSLGEIWTRIQLNLLKNQQQNPNGGDQRRGNQQRSPNGRQQPRLPNGRGTPPDTGGGRLQPDELAPVSQSYEDILRDVMKATG